MSLKAERAACAAWLASFQKIPTRLIGRTYRANDGAELKLLAGGERRSSCCRGYAALRCKTLETVMHSDGRDDAATAYRCERCGKECVPYWRGVDIEDEWPAASDVMFACPVEDSWFRENAERIAAECALLVYDAPDVGVLLGVDESEPGDLALHWLPLFRMRGRRAAGPARARRS